MLTSLTLTFRLTDIIIERVRITPKETTLCPVQCPLWWPASE